MFTDKNAEELLILLEAYVTEYESCADMKISEVAEDLAMSMDVTTDRADSALRNIEGVVLNEG